MLKRFYWCNSHEREATYQNAQKTIICDPSLGGILLPCVTVDLTDQAVIGNTDDDIIGAGDAVVVKRQVTETERERLAREAKEREDAGIEVFQWQGRKGNGEHGKRIRAKKR